MANINEIIEQVQQLNPELARHIRHYVKNHSYGLVFEHNLPESVRLYKKLPSKGDTVNILPKRGETEKKENYIPWIVKAIKEKKAVIHNGQEEKIIDMEDIVTIVSYKDIIYPGLKEVDRVERGNLDDPYHMVINAENYHALEALTYAYTGKVDCIYIDPPYNSGAKDWKYNNHYVEETDIYRHSKWLAFIERRLRLAAQLLNPKESVLIITIDEKEYLRLGLLLEQVFPDAKIQMISSVINPGGTKRQNEFSRTDEYIFFVMVGSACPNPIKTAASTEIKQITWEMFRRHDLQSKRGTSKGGTSQFYPIYVEKSSGKIKKIGKPIQPNVNRNEVEEIDGCVTVFPIRDNGTEMNWGAIPSTAQTLLEKGYLKASSYDENKYQQYSIKYLTSGTIEDIEEGVAITDGYEQDGSIIAHYEEGKTVMPKTNWQIKQHNANSYGSNILKKIIGNRFDFPKSLYAVKDCLDLFVGHKKEALIIDFFAGSGTTLHAVNLMNEIDNGKRRCICVTNNEIYSKEEEDFIKKGLRPYDKEWQEKGIAYYVTWPRTKNSILGINVLGEPLQDDYGKPSTTIDLGFSLPRSHGFKSNAIFCELTYENAWPIRLDQAFDAIAPILWMLAGCKGPIIKHIGKSFLATDFYAVLFDYNQASKFCDKIKGTPTIKTVFIVTDDQRRYSNLCKRLPGIEVHRLYENYLRTFEICGEGALD